MAQAGRIAYEGKLCLQEILQIAFSRAAFVSASCQQDCEFVDCYSLPASLAKCLKAAGNGRMILNPGSGLAYLCPALLLSVQ